MRHFLRPLVLLALLMPLASQAVIAPRPSDIRSGLLSSLTFMKSVYQAKYAPTGWKQTYAGWNLDDQYARATQLAATKTPLGLLEAREILKSFIYSMQDYHVSISFHLTEKATLPFVVQGTGGKYFLAYIDRSKLAADSFPFQVGDELVTFDGKPTAEAIAAVQAETPANVPGTDLALAELTLTKRRAARGYKVPQGAVTLGIRPKGTQTVSRIQLLWDYTPESVSAGPMTPAGVLRSTGNSTSSLASLFQKEMSFDASFLKEPGMETPYDLGARKSFTPDLGTKIWESDANEVFHAYIFKGENDRLIGYVRIPSYVPEDALKAVASFAKVIGMLEAGTDALVIDQVNNPGGSVFYLYTLVSMLSDQPMVTPQHEMALSQAEVVESLNNIALLEGVKTDADAKKVLGDSLGGYPPSYETVQFMLSYLRFMVSEWNSGRTLTRPYWIAGVDHINPNPVRYTKPILLLVNALDFSGGDFFPAILQDNRRAVIMGTRTSGAGGYVNDVPFPNNLGVVSFRITESIAKRVNDNPIENLGVTPDLPYTMTENDLTHGYADYVRAIRAAVNGLMR